MEKKVALEKKINFSPLKLLHRRTLLIIFTLLMKCFFFMISVILNRYMIRKIFYFIVLKNIPLCEISGLYIVNSTLFKSKIYP